MDPDRELLAVLPRLVSAYRPTLPMPYSLGIERAEQLTQRGPSSVVEGAARTTLAPRCGRSHR